MFEGIYSEAEYIPFPLFGLFNIQQLKEEFTFMTFIALNKIQNVKSYHIMHLKRF